MHVGVLEITKNVIVLNKKNVFIFLIYSPTTRCNFYINNFVITFLKFILSMMLHNKLYFLRFYYNLKKKLHSKTVIFMMYALFVNRSTELAVSYLAFIWFNIILLPHLTPPFPHIWSH